MVRVAGVLLSLFLLSVPASAQVTAVSQDASLQTSLGTLSGTWLVPKVDGRLPIVLLIAGSGPTDRDGNSTALPGKNDSLKMLAEALAARGVATLRYDKRGIGRSATPGQREADLRFEDYVNDAANLVDIIRGDDRFSSITIAGHSEGSLIGMLAAKMSEAEGFVSISGPARNAAAILRDQLRPQLSPVPALWEATQTMIASLERGETLAPPAALASVPPVAGLFRPSVQPYLISWFRFTPSLEIAKLDVPVLVIQGTTDIQVPVGEAEALKAAKPDATLTIVTGMNHIMKSVEADPNRQIASYSDPSLKIAPEVPNAIAAFTSTVPVRPRRRP
ncbi:MAG: alpha/beta fold hydrolase [Acidobacteria bacterium]|nr:alpha/beta fold hydrolase [Acidobacteriota bacterium]